MANEGAVDEVSEVTCAYIIRQAVVPQDLTVHIQLATYLEVPLGLNLIGEPLQQGCTHIDVESCKPISLRLDIAVRNEISISTCTCIEIH